MKNRSEIAHVSRETLERLTAFEELVRKWTQKINLISPRTVPDIWERHIVDSAQFWSAVEAPPKTWTDLGSGGGFPGIVVALLSEEFEPLTKMTLVEADKRKAAFLRHAAIQLDLRSTTIASSRIEALDGARSDVVSARALAPLPKLLPLVARHLSPDGVALLAKGVAVAPELDEVAGNWRFDMVEIPSRTTENGRILRLTNIERR